MTIAEELQARELIEHESALAATILAKSRTVYLGADPTADSLHVGHLELILLMRRLGSAGHKLIFLVGGGTGMIGDPKEKGERTLLDEATIAQNVRAIKRQLKDILGSVPFTLVDNADWLKKVGIISFLRDIGKHFTVNDLVKRELIRKRLETPNESISYTEFTYALLQGYDYLTLHEKYGCDLQVGASDQWTNILSGVDLIRKIKGEEVYALTAPLVTDATGKKFGKSEGNAIWLDPKKTSPFRFYQFWYQLPDAGLEQYLKRYTFLSLEEIAAIMKEHAQEPGARRAQEALARAVTEIVHGKNAAEQAIATSEALFGSAGPDTWSKPLRAAILAEAPSLSIARASLAEGLSVAQCLAEGGLASSKSDARRLIEGKGISLNGLAVEQPDQKLYETDFVQGTALLRRGRQSVLVVTLK